MIEKIYTDGLDEGIRCAMCTNTMKSDRGCDGGCVVNDAMYKRVMDVISKAIVQEVAKEYGKDKNVRSNDWISVEERLPKEFLWGGHKKSHEVFITYLDSDGKARVDTDNTYNGKWFYFGDRVIAWMPKTAPAPYQKSPSRCDTCTHNVADEVPPICYMCSKGIEDNYERKGE